MFYRAKVWAIAFIAVVGVLSVSAFGQSIEGVVRGPDGKVLKDAEVRIEAKDKKNPLVTKTDARGHYSYKQAVSGVYKVSVVLGGVVKSTVTVQTTAANSKVDFDLKPTAGKKVKHYVWVPAPTGSHLGSGWVEVDDSGNTAPGALNSQTASGDLAREMSRRVINKPEGR